MSNARKLQTEIDRVMKKVDEGVELFDEIWEKVYSAEQQNQKEKHEMDLKKEIKKLQRLRDQIKTWIGGSEVKDKEPLVEARRLIETKMEQFKICEKETKTKTYSKEGLARAEKLDPAEEAKLSTVSWIQDYIERLKQVVEEIDFEIEKFSSGKGKKSNKHKIESLNQHILNHRYHISKLEGIIRLVNNDRLDVEPVDALKDDFDYYLDSYEDEEYISSYDPDFFYESLGLEELDVVNVDHVTQAAANAVTSKIKGMDDAASSSSRSSKDRKGAKKGALASVIPLTIGRARVASAKDKKEEEPKVTTPSKVSRSNSTASSQSSGGGMVISAPPTTPGVPAPKVIVSAVSVSAPVPSVPTPVPPAATPTVAATSMAAILKREPDQQEKERQKLLREQQARVQAEQLRLQQQQAQQRQQQEAALRQQQEAALRQQQEAAQQQEALKRQQAEAALRQQQQEAAVKQQQAAAAAAAQLQAQQQIEQNAQKLTSHQAQPMAANSALDILTSGLGGLGLSATGSVVNSADSRSSASPVPPLGVSAVAPVATNSVVTASPSAASLDIGTPYLSSALTDSYANVPNAVDNDRSRQYTPQNPYPTPASYPATPSNIFSNPAIFEKLGTDCLFFIFYYAQGTYQQYLAARELKKQSWRFHKKYMTWFQRHEEPKITTDEYEQGTYVYFDYETGWCTRIKTDFRFEYSYLEDSLQ